jgi:hypothetical protein
MTPPSVTFQILYLLALTTTPEAAHKQNPPTILGNFSSLLGRFGGRANVGLLDENTKPHLQRLRPAETLAATSTTTSTTAARRMRARAAADDDPHNSQDDDAATATTAAPCQPGRFSATGQFDTNAAGGAGASATCAASPAACDPCPPGRFAPEAGTVRECMWCVKGKFQNLEGQTACKSCSSVT